MSFNVGDIPWFDEYVFTDTGEVRSHFGLAILPETATKFQSSLLCCVITSKETKSWSMALNPSNYIACFTKESFICFDRKDLVPLDGLGGEPQPRGKLTKKDASDAYKILKKSLFCIQDIGSDIFMRGAIIREWKKAIRL